MYDYDFFESNSNDDLIKIVKQGLGLHRTADRGYTFFDGALAWGSSDLIKTCIDMGAKVEDKHLFDAVDRINTAILKLLLDAGADIHVVDKNGKGVWEHIANSEGCIDSSDGCVEYEELVRGFIDVMIAHGATLPPADDNGWTILMYAADHCAAVLLSFLIESGCDVNARTNDGSTALMVAQSAEVIKRLIGAGADVNAHDDEGWTALHSVFILRDDLFSCREIMSLKYLIDAGADVNARNCEGITPLMLWAAEDCSREAFQLLKDAGVDIAAIDNNGHSVLMHAASIFSDGFGSYPIKRIRTIRKIIGYDLDENTWPDIHDIELISAACVRTVEQLEEILKKGADINAKDITGRTPLMNAVPRNTPSVVRFLIEAGSNVNAASETGMTPLMLIAGGARKKYPRKDDEIMDIVKLLLDAGADINAKDSEGRSALMFALENENALVVKALLAAGASQPDRESGSTRAVGIDSVTFENSIEEELPPCDSAEGWENDARLLAEMQQDREAALLREIAEKCEIDVHLLAQMGAEILVEKNNAEAMCSPMHKIPADHPIEERP